MHPNPVFRNEAEARNIEFSRKKGFGILAVTESGAPLLSHIPFILSQDGKTAEFHLVRSNPIARSLRDQKLMARLAVQGPHSYISPDWYEIEDQVPTWNYIAVHLMGEVELRPQEELRNLLDRQSAVFETQLTPKTPWTTAKMTPEVLDKMMRQIVPCRMRVDKVDGTWKLNQNKPDDVRLKAADKVGENGLGAELDSLATFMRDI